MNEKKQEKLNGLDSEQESTAKELNEMQIVSIDKDPGIIDISKEIQEVEANIELYKKIWGLSLRLTKPKDWVFQDKSLYLMDTGSEHLATVWGIDLKLFGKPDLEWQKDDKGKYYIFTCYGSAYSKKLGKTIEDIGTCSSRDKLFGRASGGFKSLEDVDMDMIRKKSVTNCYNRLIKRMLGLMSIDEEDLKGAGIDTSKIARIDYKSGSQKVKQTATPKEKETQKKLWDLLMQYTGGSEEDAKEMLKKESGFKSNEGDEVEGKDDVKYLTGKWLNFTYGKIKKIAESRTPGEEG